MRALRVEELEWVTGGDAAEPEFDMTAGFSGFGGGFSAWYDANEITYVSAITVHANSAPDPLSQWSWSIGDVVAAGAGAFGGVPGVLMGIGTTLLGKYTNYVIAASSNQRAMRSDPNLQEQYMKAYPNGWPHAQP